MATGSIERSMATATETIDISIGEDQYSGFYYGSGQISGSVNNIMSILIVAVTGNNYAHIQLAGVTIRAYSSTKNLTVTARITYKV